MGGGRVRATIGLGELSNKERTILVLYVKELGLCLKMRGDFDPFVTGLMP